MKEWITIGSLIFATNCFAVEMISRVEVQSQETVTADILVVDAPAALKAELKNIKLCDAPAVGEMRKISNHVIASIFRKAIKKSGVVVDKIKIPSHIEISNKNKIYSESEVKSELLSQWQRLCQDCELYINSLSLPLLPVKRKVVHWRLDSVRSLPKGTFTQKVVLAIDGAPETFFWVTGQVEIRKKVPVVNKYMNFGSSITKDDIEWQLRDVTFSNDGTPTAEDFTGKVLKRTLQPNDIVWYGALQKAKIFKRGDIVKIVSGQGPWQITVSGEAQQDGYIGESSRVKNLKSNKVLSGIVGSLGEVEIR